MLRRNQIRFPYAPDARQRANPPAHAHKLSAILAAAFLALCALAAGSNAEPPPPQDATASASSTAPAATVVLPPRIVAGQPATLAVLDSNGTLRAGVTVELTGGAKLETDATGRATFPAPQAFGVLIAKISSAAASATAGAATLIVPPDPASTTVRPQRTPPVIALYDSFTIRGTGFAGEAAANRVTLAGSPAYVLAASPIALVIAPSQGIHPGPSTLEISANGASASAATQIASLESNADSLSLAPGQRLRLTLLITGASKPQSVEVKNLSPRVVRFRKGDHQWLSTSGGAQNGASIEIEGLGAGDFSFSAKLIPPPTGGADVPSAIQFLEAALRYASSASAPVLNKFLRQLAKNSPRVQKVYDGLGEFQRNSLEGNPEVSWLVSAARDELAGR
jgi:hypothetical protein